MIVVVGKVEFVEGDVLMCGGWFRCNNVLWISGAKGGKQEDSAMEG